MVGPSVISEDPVLVWVAGKINVDPRHFSKSLSKIQKSVDKVDCGTTSSKLCGLDKKEKIFGECLENMQFHRTSIGLGDVDFPVMIPPFLLDLASRILASKTTQGLFRTSGNARRVLLSIDAINAGMQLENMTDLTIHDLCQLLKEWVKELPKPLIPADASFYMYRLFDDTRCLSAAQKGDILRFLGSYIIPSRARGVLIFISHLLNVISSCSSVNQMTTENVARVLPTLFTGEIEVDITGPRAFAIPILLMEFLIKNPHTFTQKLTVDAILNKGREGEIPFVDKISKPEAITFNPILPTHCPVQFQAQFKPSSPARKRLEFNLRSPAQGIRNLMEHTMGGRMLHKFGRLSLSHHKQLVRRDSPSHGKPKKSTKAESPIITDKNEIIPTVVVLSPGSPKIEISNFPLEKSEDRFRTLRRQSFVTPLSPSILVSDIKMTPEEVQVNLPQRLNFDDPFLPLPPTVCSQCGKQQPFLDHIKPASVDFGVQFDPVDFQEFQNSSHADNDENTAVSWHIRSKDMNEDKERKSEKPVGRMMSVMSVIPEGIVAQRLHYMELQPSQ